MSFYAMSNAWADKPTQIFRYTLRMDGFVSRVSGYEPRELVTKPFTFDGEELHINFATSAAGYIRVTIEDENANAIPGYDSGELFGDSVDRIVDFERSVSELAGCAVTLRIEMSDAEVYSFRFVKK